MGHGDHEGFPKQLQLFAIDAPQKGLPIIETLNLRRAYTSLCSPIYELQSKLLKGGYLGDCIEDYNNWGLLRGILGV